MQHGHDKKKIYSVHEPHVECISKGKRTKGMSLAARSVWRLPAATGAFVGAMAAHGNPYDGHTLKDALEQVQRVAGDPEHAILLDKGYRGHG